MNYLNSNLAREAGRLIRWREKFWGRRYQAILVSNEEEAQVARLRYVLAHGAKEGLVASPLDWPGAHCARALVEDRPVEGRWIDRTLEFIMNRKRLPIDPEDLVTRESLRLSSLPCWRHRDNKAWRSDVEGLIRAIEAGGVQREATTGRPPLGRDAVIP